MTIKFWNQLDSRKIMYSGNMKDHYPDSKFETLDNPPTPRGDPVKVNIYVDASYVKDKLYVKLVRGTLVYIEDMLIKSVRKDKKV